MFFFLLLTVAQAYYQPGDPPQCFDEYQCVFFRFPVEIGLKSAYTWDLRSLCAGEGSEYIAGKDPNCVLSATGVCPPGCYNDCKPDKSPKIRFNICGTVSGPLAPVKEENCPGGDPTQCPGGVGSMQELPIPASHGVAVQVRFSALRSVCALGLRNERTSSPLPLLSLFPSCCHLAAF